MNKKDLSVIIVNYNTRVLLKDCLKSIAENTRNVNYEVIVVDNASSDGSTAMVEKEFPWVRLVCNERNAGFSKANNQGIHIAHGENILLLNSDTLILGNCLFHALEFLRNTADAGVVGCKVLNHDKTLQLSCYHFPSLLTEWVFFTKGVIKNIWDPVTWYKYMRYWDHNKIRTVDCVSGCFFLVKRRVFDSIGLLDENSFMYYEDSEFCKRLRLQSDYKVYYYPYAEIIHLKGASSNYTPNTPSNHASLQHSYKTARYYLNKCYGKRIEKTFALLCKAAWHIELFIFSALKFEKRFNKKTFMLRELINS